MNYHGKKVAVTGVSGFLGSHIVAALENERATIVELEGDVRKAGTFSQLNHTFDYLFHFAAPSSEVLFQRDPAHCIAVTLGGIQNAAEAAKRAGVRLVYPSTGLLSMSKYGTAGASDQENVARLSSTLLAMEGNMYARCKKVCEDFVSGMRMDAIGIRLFAAYGPGEDHKRDYASVPFLFARDMVNGRTPVVFGDGQQKRDFIYIDDAAQAILHLAEECSDPIVDVASGQQISFESIVIAVGAALGLQDTAAQAMPAPAAYAKETIADPQRMLQFYKPQVSFADGIKRTVEHLQELKAGAQQA